MAGVCALVNAGTSVSVSTVLWSLMPAVLPADVVCLPPIAAHGDPATLPYAGSRVPCHCICSLSMLVYFIEGASL